MMAKFKPSMCRLAHGGPLWNGQAGSRSGNDLRVYRVTGVTRLEGWTVENYVLNVNELEHQPTNHT